MLQTSEWFNRIKKSDKLPLVIIGLVACAFTAYYILAPSPVYEGISGPGFPVPVLLATAQPDEILHFSVNGPYKIFGGDRSRPYLAPGHLYSGLRLKTGQVYYQPRTGLMVNGKPVPGDVLQIVPQDNGVLEHNERLYSGTFKVQLAEKNELLLFNRVNLEDYLAGVLFKEMPASFESEALKAQVVAARSYAIHRILSGADYLTDDTRTQVYGGVEAVTTKSRELVEATRGEILIYEDAILPAFYCSTCGGTTAKASDVFGGDAPYPVDQSRLCGYCTPSPTYKWQAVFTREEIRQSLSLPAKIGRFNIGITAWDSMRRAQEISIMDPKEGIIARFSARAFRQTMNEGRALNKCILSTLIDRIVPRKDEFVFEGRGWGHGVGLCQYGAQGLAVKGKSYRKILEYYYPEARVESFDSGILAGGAATTSTAGMIKAR